MQKKKNPKLSFAIHAAFKIHNGMEMQSKQPCVHTNIWDDQSIPGASVTATRVGRASVFEAKQTTNSTALYIYAYNTEN